MNELGLIYTIQRLRNNPKNADTAVRSVQSTSRHRSHQARCNSSYRLPGRAATITAQLDNLKQQLVSKHFGKRPLRTRNWQIFPTLKGSKCSSNEEARWVSARPESFFLNGLKKLEQRGHSSAWRSGRTWRVNPVACFIHNAKELSTAFCSRRHCGGNLGTNTLTSPDSSCWLKVGT
jgi:hypothetical protein